MAGSRKAIRSFRTRKNMKKGREIGKESWKKHFENLFRAMKDLEFSPKERTNKKVRNKKEKVIEVEPRIKEVENSSRIEEGNSLNKDISFKEFVNSLKKMKNGKGKSSRRDSMTIEYIRGIPRIWAEKCHQILNGFWKTSQMVKGWGNADIALIFKGGEKGDTVDYKGLSLLDIGYTIMASKMDERIRGWLEKEGIYKES